MRIPGRRINKDEVVITDPFPRGGDGLFLRAQIMSSGGTPTGGTKIEVFSRNYEDQWDSSPITGASVTISAGDGVVEIHVAPSSTATAGIKEQLRLKITGPTGDGWMVIRIFPPLFYDAAIGSV